MADNNEKKSELWEAGQNWVRKMDNLFNNRPQNNVLGSIDAFFQQSRAFRRIPVYLHETDSEWIAEIELPGLRKEDINLDIIDKQLRVSVSEQEQAEVDDDQTNYYYRQNKYQHWERTVQLPYPVDKRTTKATYREGVLVVRGPRPRKSRTHLNIE